MLPRVGKWLIGSSLLLLAGAAAGGIWDRAVGRSSSGHDVALLYVGADDCAPCRVWQGGAGARFRSSAEFARVTYREIKSPTVLDVLKDDYWPQDLRRYRDQLNAGAGVPLWLVISDGELVERGFGESQWAGTVLPKVKSLLR